jgi:hypothetical protein
MTVNNLQVTLFARGKDQDLPEFYSSLYHQKFLLYRVLIPAAGGNCDPIPNLMKIIRNLLSANPSYKIKRFTQSKRKAQMSQKNGFQELLSSPWGVIGFMVMVGGGLLLLSLLVLVLFGVNIGGLTS